MNTKTIRTAAVCCSALACSTSVIKDARAQFVAPITLRSTPSPVSFPIWACAPSARSDFLFVAGLSGSINSIDLPGGQFSADRQFILPNVVRTSEGGLLGMTCHPRFEENGFLYVYYTNILPEIPNQFSPNIAIVRFTCPLPTRRIIDPTSRTVIFSEPDAGSIHIAGWLDFGPDGMLYAAIGERGWDSLAQSLNTARGKVLRIDVDSDAFPADPIRNYAIPPKNPFAGGGGLPEILLWGLRNPFRCGFDVPRRLLYVGDVGQFYREEISVVPIDGPGRNLGWPCYEGTEQQSTFDNCATIQNPVFPFIEYRPSDLPPLFRSGASVISGGAYSGCAIPSLRNRALLSDFYWQRDFYTCSVVDNQATDIQRHTFQALGGNITGFARDGLGEIYILSNTGIHKLIPATPQSADFNTDGAVNTPDLIFLLARFGQPATTGNPAAIADFNASGTIDTPDLTYFLARFATTCP